MAPVTELDSPWCPGLQRALCLWLVFMQDWKLKLPCEIQGRGLAVSGFSMKYIQIVH